MKNYLLFTDGSVNTKLKTGYGAFLIIPEENLEKLSDDEVDKIIQIKKFESTTSTRLEIETLLWALKETKKMFGEEITNIKIFIYSDSQNIAGLLDRRQGLEQNNFISKRSNKELNNSNLYKEFYNLTDNLNCSFIKLKGHSKAALKNNVDKIFTRVDRASRKAIRNNSFISQPGSVPPG